jgi:hypothetical protein
MSSSGCIYVLVSSEQFSVVSCIHHDILISSIHHLHMQMIEDRNNNILIFILLLVTKKINYSYLLTLDFLYTFLQDFFV